jgi:membrane associated rhomboid family serine protease
MNAAAVGFQCPDCVREGNRTTRQGRTVFGGSTAGERGTVTYVLIAINIAIYVLNLVWSLALGFTPQQVGLIAYGGGGPVLQFFATEPNGVASGEFYRLITADFVHIGILHIALNMYALWLFGRETERLVGRWRFAVLYLLAGLGGTTAIYLFGAAGAGASASIFGLFGALIFFFRKLNANIGGLATVIVLNLVITFVVPGISIFGHIGGLVAGAVLGLGLAYAPRGQWRLPVQIGTLVGVGLVLAVLVALRTAAYGLFG